MFTEGEVGSVWRVLTTDLNLGLNFKMVRLKKDDLIFVLHEDRSRNTLLTHRGIVDVFRVWQKYCMRIA